MNFRRIAVAVLCLVSWVVLAAPVAAVEVEGVRFAERFEAEGEPLALRGAGLLRHRIIFRGYVAALYVDPEVPSSEVLSDVPKRLEIEYFWSIQGDQFGKAAEPFLSENAGATLADIRDRVDRISGAYRDIEPGDRYALTYTPGIGTELSLNGEVLVTIPGADFAAAYFAIWLGNEPLDEGLRDKLLAG